MTRMFLGAALAALAAGAHAAPPQYRVIETGVASQATAFNNQGEIVFRFVPGFDLYGQAAIWSAGTLSSPFTGYTLPEGVSWAQFNGWGVNDHGVMVGLLARSDWSYGKLFRWDSKTGDLAVFEKLVEPDGYSYGLDSGVDINNAGAILGQSRSWNSYGHVRDGEDIRWLQDDLWRSAAQVRAINDHGDVVGLGADAAFQSFGMVWMADGTRHFIDPLGTDEFGYRFATGVSINDGGTALFNSSTAIRNENMPFLWNAGVTTPLGFYAAGFGQTIATGLNDSGAVTGYAYNQSLLESVSFLWQDGAFWNLQSLLAPEFQDWTIDSGGQPLINNLGQIAAWACKPFGNCQTLLLDPIGIAPPPPPPPGGGGVVPEPASWAMLIAGFGLVGSALRRRRPLATVTA